MNFDYFYRDNPDIAVLVCPLPQPLEGGVRASLRGLVPVGWALPTI
jgi:hypothetical protein